MKYIIKILAAIICSILLWETILECTVIRSPGAINHPILGRIYREGLYVHGQEGFAITHVNSLGMRNTEITPKKNNEFRILVLGDSYTEAMQVSDNQTFSYLLGRALEARTNNVNVINAGRSGAAPAYYIHLADFYIRTLQPDYIVVQLNEGDVTQDFFDDKKYFYVKETDGEYSTIENKNFLSTNALTQKFSSLGFLTQVSTLRIGSEKIHKIFQAKKLAGELATQQTETNYDNIIEWTVRTLASKYNNVVIIYLPTIDYGNLMVSPTEIERSLTKYAKSYKVGFINMRPDFINEYKSTLQPLHGFDNTLPGTGHINKSGHILVAQQLAKYFEGGVLK